MLKIYIVAILNALFLLSKLSAECFLCEEIKERNRHLPPLKFEYYDEYLEYLKQQGKPLPGDIEFEGEQQQSEDEQSVKNESDSDKQKGGQTISD